MSNTGPTVPASQQRQRPPAPIDTRPQLDKILAALEGIAAKLDTLTAALAEDDPAPNLQSNTVKVVTTGTAVRLGMEPVTAVVIQALQANAGTVTVGNQAISTTVGYQLQAGQAVGVAIEGLWQLSVNGTAGDGVCWIGS